MFPRLRRLVPNVKANWKEKAYCAQRIQGDPSLAGAWITENGPDTEVARRICHVCTVRSDCLFAALEDPHAEGMRGGYQFSHGTLTADENRRLKREYSITTKPRHKK